MVKVCCKFEQNRTKAIILWLNDGHAENSISPKTMFCMGGGGGGGYYNMAVIRLFCKGAVWSRSALFVLTDLSVWKIKIITVHIFYDFFAEITVF